MCKISAILPAYNVEKYLEECVNSILGQDIETEIIIINDGSTDNTLSVANSLAEKHSNILVLTQENSGQSVARNRGIEIAKGEYLLLLDSDDFLIENTLKSLYERAIENDLDYIKTGWITFDEKSEFVTIPTIEFQNKVITSLEFFNQSIKGGYNCVIWNGIIKREFLNKIGIKYAEGIQYEDNTFALELYLSNFNAKVMQVNDLLLKVRLHENTTTSSKPKIKKITDILKNVELMNSFINTLPQEIHSVAKKAVASLVFAMTSLYFKLDRKDKKQANKLIPKKVLKDAIKNPYDSFQKKKVFMFTYFRPLLVLYNVTIRSLVVKIRNKKRSKNG